MTCFFDLELTSPLLEDSTHSCKWASCEHTHASFHSESQLSRDSLREVLCRQLLVRGFRDRGFRCIGWLSVVHLRGTDVLHWISLAQLLFVWV